MKKLNIGLIGCGTVGTGVAKLICKRKSFIKEKFGCQLNLKTICDLVISKKKLKGMGTVKLTKNYKDILNDNSIDVVVELIGGIHPAKEIALAALKNGKHFITANKALISQCGKELFQTAKKNNCQISFESAVGAGTPIIKLMTEGLAGNKFNSLYGIVNGTCNYILTEMTENNYTFEQALKDAQAKGFAEADPTLDINGMDTAHKLAILVNLAFNQIVKVKEIYTEGISQISHVDIEYAKQMDLSIKLLAIAKKINNELEIRVHPTLISKNHPLDSVDGIYNALFLDCDPLGNILLYGEGAGEMAAASGVFSDLINLAIHSENEASPMMSVLSNTKTSSLKLRKIDQIETKFYIRVIAIDKPGVLSKIAGVLGKYSIGIASVSQRESKIAKAVPVVMLTHGATENNLRKALKELTKLSIIKGKPIAIRMELD